MPLATIDVPNLINGVSQQPAKLRLPSQCELMENAYPSVVDGLVKRNPAIHVKTLATGFEEADVFSHAILRDSSERYLVLILDGDLKVFDYATGQEKTVAFPDGKTYLDAPAGKPPKFSAVTVADHTFIANKHTEAAMSGAPAAAKLPEALIRIRQGVAETWYMIRVGGVIKASIETGATPSTYQTNDIAGELQSQLVASLGSSYSIARTGNNIYIRRTDGGEFDATVQDSYGGKAMSIAKGEVQSFRDLPDIGRQGFEIRISGDDTTGFDDYYVKFRANETSTQFSHGVWEECVAPGLDNNFDASTLPHVLVREADGTFTFKQHTWAARDAGDEDSNKQPSFVGQKIQDVFFYRNRLGFLADNKVILSRAGEYSNFWNETATSLLDSDRIDIAASATSKISILYHAVPWNDSLLLFSDHNQLELSGGDLLSPKTVPDLRQTTAFTCSTNAAPIGSGKNVFFATKSGNFAGVREYFVQEDVTISDAANITSHVPEYIEGTITALTGSSLEDVLCVLAAGAPNAVYVYKYYWGGNSGTEKLQSAWCKYVFDASAQILSAEFVDTRLYMAIKRGTDLSLEYVEFAASGYSANETLEIETSPGVYETATGLSFDILLDRRVNGSSSEVTVGYDSTTDVTTYTLPYAATEATAVVVSHALPASVPAGSRPTIVDTDGNTVSIAGDFQNVPVYIGQDYTMRYRFSAPVLRRGDNIVMADGRLQLRRVGLTFQDAGPFKVEVTPKARQTLTSHFTGNRLGSNSILGQVNLEDGTHAVSTRGESGTVQVDIVNDTPFPAKFLYASWEVFYNARRVR